MSRIVGYHSDSVCHSRSAMALRITWTRRALELPEHVREELTSRLNRLHRYFPEVRVGVRIGITRSLEGFAFQSDKGDAKLMLEVRRGRDGRWKLPTYWTLGHELMHLAQFNSSDIPEGERACDVFALARLPPRFIDEAPSYLVVPRGCRGRWTRRHARFAHDVAKEALAFRSSGLRRYVVWWEREFDRRAGRSTLRTTRQCGPRG